MLNVENLFRTQGEFQFGPATFSVEDGENIALIGPNGAGKSTLMKQITGHWESERGEVFLTVNDQRMRIHPDNTEAKRCIGYLPQEQQLPPWVKGIDLLQYVASLHNIPDRNKRVESELAKWDCLTYCHQPVSTYSHGMQKRIGLAVTFINNPAFAVLDEPFTGLDIGHTSTLVKTIQQRQQKGCSHLISTHIIPYAAQLCTKALSISDGKLKIVEEWPNLDIGGRIKLIDQIFDLV